MRGTIVSIRLNGYRNVTQVQGPPQLDLLKSAIDGGYLELVPYFDSYEHEGKWVKCMAFCDEHGKQNNLPVNVEATVLWDKVMVRAGRKGLVTVDGQMADVLVGPVAIVFGDEAFMRAL